MIKFKNLEFSIEDGKIFLCRCGNLKNLHTGFVQVQVCGENKDSHLGAKMANSSEGIRMCYVSHSIDGGSLTIIQKSPLIETKTIFTTYDDTNAIRVQTQVTNTASFPIVLEEVSAFTFNGLGPISDPDALYFTRFLQSHHAECQPKRFSFRELGLYGSVRESQKRLSCANIGSWSTKEELPQGILENVSEGTYLMFQIESNASWYYEISDVQSQYYLYLGGPNLPFGGWSRELAPGESYTTPAAALAFGEALDEVVGELTKYRRHIAGTCQADDTLPTIFNEYMHLSWDNPTAENTEKYAPVVAKTGIEYYVIDCGWHNEEPGYSVYPFVGHWLESHARFPEGLRKTTDYIRSLGMKPGLWIEPEIIGIQCEKMLQYYDDDCFLQRNGRRLAVMNRHFLDYRHPKVRSYMTETIRRMVEDYGAEYIKVDYNQDCGVGTDREAFSPGSGLEDCASAFLDWIREMTRRYPDVIFEGCSSGGMRMDYKTLSAYSLISTSDQTDYLQYPYIAGNILAAVLPEQAAVWSYPVTEDCIGPDVSDTRIVMNMVNSFLGRMHLASHLERLNEHQLSLIREGIDYYNSLSSVKKNALPCFPLGFTDFSEKQVCAGFKTGQKMYLAVWNLDKARDIRVPLREQIDSAHIAYPSAGNAVLDIEESSITVAFPEANSAVFLEVQLK